MNETRIHYPEVVSVAGWFVLGTLAAFGLLSVLWALLGWLLPGDRGCALVCWGIPDEGTLARLGWLRSLGLLHCPLLVVAEEGQAIPPGTEICSGEALLSRLEWERNRFHGTGNGDYTGCHQCGGISEL